MLLFMIDIDPINTFKQTVIYNEVKQLTVLKVHVCMYARDKSYVFHVYLLCI